VKLEISLDTGKLKHDLKRQWSSKRWEEQLKEQELSL